MSTLQEKNRGKLKAYVVGQNGDGLLFAYSDGLLISSKLQDMGYEITEELYKGNEKNPLTVHRMRKSFRRFVRTLTEGDMFVFYYSGFGFQVKGKNYLVGAKDEYDDEMEDRMIELDFFIKLLREKDTKNVFFLDCCQENPENETWKGSGSGTGKPISNIKVNGGSFVTGFASLPGLRTKEVGGGVFTRSLYKFISSGEEILTILRKTNLDMYKQEGLQGSIFLTGATGDLYLSEPGKVQDAKDYEHEKADEITRIDRLVGDIQSEEYWNFDPTRYASQKGKLEYSHNIHKVNFICQFREKRSDFQMNDVLGDGVRPDEYFENVVVNHEQDEKLGEFEERIMDEYEFKVKEELRKKDQQSVIRMERIVKELIGEVTTFFDYPGKIGPEEAVKIRSGIKDSKKKRGGNNLFLGDLHQKIGYCRHHSTLFKLVCDIVGIRCKLEFVYNYHAWNVVQIKDRFYIVDITNFTDQLHDVEQYYQALSRNVGSCRDKRAKESIREILQEKKLEKARVSRIREYTNKSKRDEFEVLEGKKGGFGDITLYQIKKDVVQDDTDVVLFKKGEVLAVKKIKTRRDQFPNKVLGGSSSDKIPLSYALREASHMKILDHSSIIEVIGFWVEEENGFVFIAMKSMDNDGREFFELLTRRRENLKLEELKRRSEYDEEDEGEVEDLSSVKIGELVELKMRIEVIYFLLETARGLRYLAKLNITHLDMKLENVMIRWDKQKEEILDVRIIDFGGAKNNDLKTSSFTTTEGYDAPEIQDIKLVKEIKIMVQKFKDSRRQQTAHNFNKMQRKFEDLHNLKRLLELEEEFKFVCEKSKNRRFRMTSGWKEEISKKLAKAKLLSEMHETSEFEDEDKPFDCRADVYSFGVMMEEFLKEKLIPQELVFLVGRCLESDRRNRPTIDEIVFILSRHLSFCNERMKEEERKRRK